MYLLNVRRKDSDIIKHIACPTVRIAYTRARPYVMAGGIDLIYLTTIGGKPIPF